MQDSLEAAERELMAAKDTFIEFGDEISAARCALTSPKIHFTTARDDFKRSGHRLGAAQCNRLGNFSEADAELQSALAEFEALAELTGMAECAVNLGDLRVHRDGLALYHLNLGKLRHAQGRLQDATENFSIAEEIYTAIGNQRFATICREWIAKIRDSLY
ncbi:hypothetical protein BKA62DRAFT_725791 [Auriculariales sp. MPI-PUGE-AT-0066]|nr:hypothetical protein BKA62DRAFT_725791 [Auriculariales sp. MPI-PUGE-AT-0066]